MFLVVSKSECSEDKASRSNPSLGWSSATEMRVTSSMYSSHAALRSLSAGSHVPSIPPMYGNLRLTLILLNFGIAFFFPAFPYECRNAAMARASIPYSPLRFDNPVSTHSRYVREPRTQHTLYSRSHPNHYA